MRGFRGEAAGLRYVQVEPDRDAAELPLIIAMHGRGADATDLAPLAAEFGGGGAYRWLFPQGPRPVPLAPDLVGWAWYELDQRQAETVVESRDLLAPFIDHVLGQTSVPRQRSLLMGFSQGAVMALHVGLASEEPFAAIVAMSGHLPAAEALLPILTHRRDRKVLIVHGADDQTLPVQLGRRARDILLKAGLQPEYAEFPMGHQITAESLAAVREFVHRVLPPGAI